MLPSLWVLPPPTLDDALRVRCDARFARVREPQTMLRHPFYSTVLALVLTVVPAVPMIPVAKATAFDMDDLAARAWQLASEPYQEQAKVDSWLLEMSYDEWRDIRFRPEKAAWRDRGSPFEIQFFHPGMFYDRAVKINEVDAEGVHPMQFSPSQFDYGKTPFASKVPQDLGYAGFRVHYPIKRADYRDEVIVFLGATYFRAVGRDQVFGGSARAVAVNTALPSGEEFPFFREFWLVRPTRTAKHLIVYALADGASLTGAYKFVIRPGVETVVEVDARLYRRREIRKLGLAPLTSMFFFGENTAKSYDRFQPEIHDSDGLLIATGDGEWIWRPLDNPSNLQVNAFVVKSPKGFGLVQRDRDFDHYLDLESRQDTRPSMWVVPKNDWGRGHVELVEIPTDADYNDNVVAYWVPTSTPEASKPVTFSYALYWYGEDSSRPPDGRSAFTRREGGTTSGTHRFVVDFTGGRLEKLAADTVLRAVVTVASGEESAEIVEQQAVKNPVTGAWRMTFVAKPKSNDPVELRAFLDLGGSALTETWTYTLLP